MKINNVDKQFIVDHCFAQRITSKQDLMRIKQNVPNMSQHYTSVTFLKKYRNWQVRVRTVPLHPKALDSLEFAERYSLFVCVFRTALSLVLS